MSDHDSEDEWETWRSEPYFKGSSYLSGTGKSYILVEVMTGPDLPICEGGEYLFLDFKDGTTKEDMLELINLMNERISHIGYTAPIVPLKFPRNSK